MEYDSVHISKGPVVAMGVSGIVEQVSADQVAKTPCPGLDHKQCRKDLNLEAQIYRLLGSHPRLVKFFGQNELDGTIILEYMPNGTLRDYLTAHHSSLSTQQKCRLSLEAVEGVAILHEKRIIHCDLSPRNLLLDAGLGLKISDFSGASLDGSMSSAEIPVRFRYPQKAKSMPTVHTDIFALGSTMYEIMTGEAPYPDLNSSEVVGRFEHAQFPEVGDLCIGSVIHACWTLQFSDIKEVQSALTTAIESVCPS